ncbi:MAG: ABC transporter substrate-binding protein [Acetobacteraceae bacterium]|nr:ABC transporter substrate-binding protein [Acetobacteraceae bacterium]
MIKRRSILAATAAAAPLLASARPARAQAPRGGTLRVAITADINNFDPMAFSTVNFPLIKNLYDSLLEYTPQGEAVPSLAEAWQIAPDNASVTLTLRNGVKFPSGGAVDSAAVAATLKKAADPQKGRNVYATMSIVKDWTVLDPRTVRIDFKAPVPTRQITDLLQFMPVLDPAGIDTIDTKPAGCGPYVLAERAVGNRVRMTANPGYWRADQPLCKELVLQVFSDDQAASAALETGAVDIIYGGTSRSAVRLKSAGFQVIEGPGPLVQVFRINTTRGPFRTEKFRQAFNFLIDRASVLRVGYAGMGQVTALPWAPVSPAADPSYNQLYAYDIEKGRALLGQSGLSAAQQAEWKILTNGGDEPSVLISQVVQATMRRIGLNVDLDLKQGAEYIDALLTGKFDATFGGVGNVQKFPSRLTTNSIYRTSNNPVLGEPHPFPAYVAAIQRVNTTLAPDSAVKAAYDNLNKVLVESAFGIPTNTYQFGLIVAARNVRGFTLDIDNILVGRTVGFAA